MSEAHAALLHELCAALREACTSEVLGRLWGVLSKLQVSSYRRLVHERFGGEYMILPTKLPDDAPADLRARYHELRLYALRSEK